MNKNRYSVSSEEEKISPVIQSLHDHLKVLEELGALIAAAHVEAAIESCCKQFEIERNASKSD